MSVMRIEQCLKIRENGGLGPCDSSNQILRRAPQQVQNYSTAQILLGQTEHDASKRRIVLVRTVKQKSAEHDAYGLQKTVTLN